MNEIIPLSWQTDRGEVRVLLGCTAREVEPLCLSDGIGEFEDYRSLLFSKNSLMKAAADPKSCLCLALRQDQIVAYCLDRPPLEHERWARMDPPVLTEVLAETARGWRGMRIMTHLLNHLFKYLDIEQRILYMVGYSWTWDLKNSGYDATGYREALKNLLTPHGFKEYPTNESNVSLRKDNLFMARIGAGINEGTRKKFKNLLFGIREDCN